eukprot:7363356-Ditylum_brightwellii.AAC.1
MSGTAKQPNAEARQLAFTAEETHRKGSASKNGTEDSKSAASKFALRKFSIQKGSAQRMIKSHSDASNSAKDNKSTKDWTINKLRFNAVGLLGRNNEINTLHACWDRMMQPKQQTKEV